MITTFRNEKFLKRKCRHVEKRLGLPAGFVQIRYNTPDTEDHKRGCFNAHFDVYNYIVEQNIQRCLIFEDDVHFLRRVQNKDYLRNLKELDWDVFYFGHKPDFRQGTFAWSTRESHIIKVRTNDRHAYVMTNHFARVMAGKPWTGKFGDRLLRSSTDKAYALYPMAAIQSGPLFSRSFYNGITEKFSEYIGLINQRPVRYRRTFRYIIRFLWVMPYTVLLAVILGAGMNRFYPNE